MPALENRDASTEPWWRIKMVWLVIAGPLTVVVASLITVTIAVRGADDILTHSAAAERSAKSHVPAVQARNHAVSAQP